MVQTTNLELAIKMFRSYPAELIHCMVVLLSRSLLQSSIVLPLAPMEKSTLGDLEGEAALDILNLTFTGIHCLWQYCSFKICLTRFQVEHEKIHFSLLSESLSARILFQAYHRILERLCKPQLNFIFCFLLFQWPSCSYHSPEGDIWFRNSQSKGSCSS